YQLIQEHLYLNPWCLLVATIFLNRTRGSVALPILHDFFNMCPTPTAASNANVKELAELLKPLGLHNRRAQRLIDFSAAYIQFQIEPTANGEEGHSTDGKNSYSPRKLPGIGKYGEDSWRI
ncbi:DNA glycosylase, partial [Cladochytrium replicatum]